jgi:hypothetical protein
MTQDYYGTKRITAWSENRGVEPTGEPGYAVRYEGGYHSWSPKAVFEAAYQPITAMGFGHALQALKEGHRVGRQGWNGKGMWLKHIPSESWAYMPTGYVNDQGHTGFKREYVEAAFIAMKTADGKFVPWLASQTDMLAEDWMIVE